MRTSVPLVKQVQAAHAAKMAPQQVTFGWVGVDEVGLFYGLKVTAPMAGPNIDAAIPASCH